MLHFRNYVKSYSEHLILTIPQLDLSPGVYWIKGENGSGKSTLFKTIAGILPFDGEICLHNGPDLKKNPIEFRKRVNYGEAEPVFPGFATAKDLIHFTSQAKKSTRQQNQHVINALEINSFLDKPCETYSSGMLKKTSLALSFLGNPDILILDEPLITLDSQSRDNLFNLIETFQKERERIVLLSSHHSFELPRLAFRQIFSIQQKNLIGAETL